MVKNMIKTKINRYPCLTCVIIFAICIIARFVEYFAIRTDKTIVSENFIHKVFGIIILLITLRLCQLTWKNIGFKSENLFKNLCKGLLLGFCCFSISYSIEFIVNLIQNKNPQFVIYASGFSISGEQVQQTGITFIILCILFNIINVWMEEGVFRGLFLNILESKYSFLVANIISAILFGVWHWVMPMRSYIDGESSLPNLLVMGIGYIILAGVMSIKWSILYKMTGTLWVGLGDHLFNNIIATNLLHVVSNTGSDELQIVRIMIAQILSFIIVYISYKKYIAKSE